MEGNELTRVRFGSERGNSMAIAGSATTAYTYRLRGDVLTIIASGARQWDACLSVADAVAALAAGQDATVAAGDATALRAAVTGKGARGEAGR